MVGGSISETRKIAAILVADVVGYSRLTGADEDRTLSRLWGCAANPIDPAWATKVPCCRPYREFDSSVPTKKSPY